MSEIQYPSNVLPLANASFRENNATTVIRSKMESGRFRQRRRYSNEVLSGTVTFDFLSDEYGAFRAFWFYELLSGSNWFRMDMPVGDGNILTNATVRFTSDYTANHRAHGNWRVSAKIEFKDSNIMAKDIYDIIKDGDPEGFIEASNYLWEECEHFDTEHPFHDWNF